MSDSAAADDTDASRSPSERAHEALQSAVAGLSAAMDSAENAAVAGQAEHHAVTQVVEAVSEALVDGMNEPVGYFAGMLADECQYHVKTDIKELITDAVEERRGQHKQPLCEFVDDRLESVTVVKTTDHRQGAEYVWDFGTFKVETQSGKDGRGHFSFPHFRDYIHESGGVNLAKPRKDRRGGEEWRDFIIGMIEDRGTTTRTRGPRTEAFEALSNKIKRLTGYGTPEGALDHSGIWVVHKTSDAPPEWWAVYGEDPSQNRDLLPELVNEVRVHESVIKPIVDDAEITRSAFYHELNARNLTVPGASGASIMEYVDGEDQRFWTLLPDAGTPRTYVPDPNPEPAPYGLALLDDDSDDGQQVAPLRAGNISGTDEPTTPAEPPRQMSEKSDGDDSDGDGFDGVGEIE